MFIYSFKNAISKERDRAKKIEKYNKMTYAIVILLYISPSKSVGKVEMPGGRRQGYGWLNREDALGMTFWDF